MNKGTYKVQLIDTEEKERIYEKHEKRYLYTRKASIYGCCIKLLTDLDYVKELWDDNFYSMSEDVRSHGRLIVLEDPSKELSVKYDPYTKTAFLFNVNYYGWVKSLALAVAGDVLEDEHRIYSVHGAAIDVGGCGVSLIAPPGTGKTTHSWGLLRLETARLVADDWYFVRLSSREPLAFGSEKNSYIEADIGKIWGVYEKLVERVQFDPQGRAIVNVRWIVGAGGVIPMTSMNKVILLKRDPKDKKAVRNLAEEEALEYLLANNFCNPHQPVADKRKEELRKRFFRDYLKQTDVYMVNTVSPPPETQSRIRKIINERVARMKRRLTEIRDDIHIGATPNLKLIYVVIDGLADLPIPQFRNETPLGVADTPNLDRLAWNGKTGLMYTVGKGIAPESDVGVISILGYNPFKYSTGRGILEAIGAGLDVNNGELALRCNFATVGRGGKIVDRRAGRDLTTKEAHELSTAINNRVRLTSYPATFKFKSTIGHRAVLVIKREGKPLSSKIENTDPAYARVEGLGVATTKVKMILKQCEPVDGGEEAKAAATLVNEFTEKSRRVLGRHEINKKRSAEGRLKANAILTRDAGHLLPDFFDINERYRTRFACLADMPVERGIAKLAGMRLVDLPPPSRYLKEDCFIRVKKLLEVLPRYDCFYIHIKGPDEPGHDGNFKLKTRLIEIIDSAFFGRLLPKIDLPKHILCVASDHATPCLLKSHSDDPVPVLIAGDKIKGDEVLKFSEKECRKGSLGVLKHGTQLMPKLMSLLKSR